MRRGRGVGGRLLALQVGVLLAGLLYAARLVQVQVVRHEHYLAVAKNQWERRIAIPPRRGELRDRRGRTLAVSTSHWRVGVASSRVDDPDLTAGRIADALGVPAGPLARRIREAGGTHLVVVRRAVLHRDVLDRLRRTPGVTLERLETRTYPYDGTGLSLIGTYRRDPSGECLATALELGLDDLLGGRPGTALEWETGRGHSAGYRVLVPPVDGHDVTLTIDIDLQRIAETCLEASVAETGAAGGSVLIMEPWTGEILAAADTPVVHDRERAPADPGLWNNFNFTGAYEPGSIFKVFTTAALLEHAAIDTATVIDCADTRFGGYRIGNADGHEFGRMSLLEAFAHSSNVYFAKAVLNLSRVEFYRTLTALGFGREVGLAYPGATRGLLREPSRWSGRSQSTLAIGQELSATPVQLATAAAAVANGGRLLVPRLVAAVDGRTDGHGPLVRGRVMSERTAALLREAMRRVVGEGTGKAAAVPWTTTAGKTGTAQKAREDGRGYMPGKYVASFLGFVPADRPRLVVLTVLDEPDRVHHYASASAAPLFARIVEEIGRSTDWLRDVVAPAAVLTPPAPGRLRVPDVLYTDVATAGELLARAGLLVRASGSGGLVVGERPTPGTLCTPGTVVELAVAAAEPPRGAPCPDWRGLSNREVRRRAAALGVTVRCKGVGYVVSQRPAPGAPLPDGPIVVTMELP